MIVNITKSDIENAVGGLCPIAIKLRQQMDSPFKVGMKCLVVQPIGRKVRHIEWPKRVAEWIQRSDNDLVVEPIQFTIAV